MEKEFWLQLFSDGTWERVEIEPGIWKRYAVHNIQQFIVTDTLTMWWIDDPVPTEDFNHAAIAIIRAHGYEDVVARGTVMFTGATAFIDGQQKISLEDEARVCAFASHCQAELKARPV